MQSDDSQLIARLQAGDLDALGELYDRYRLLVYRTALSVVRNPDSAEDITQDVFLRLYDYSSRVDRSRPLPPWLYRVTVNFAYTWSTRRKRWGTRVGSWLGRLFETGRLGPEQTVEQHDELRALQAAVDNLPLNQRIVVVLYYQQGLNLQAIAEILERPVGTVKSRLHYGRENLRRSLSNETGAGAVAYEFT
ncbi:MAG: RNA polymerase sigma factor [Anaerolineales bacterium]